MLRLVFIVECGIALSLCYACIRHLGIIFIPKATFVPKFVSFVASIAELAHGEKFCTLSLDQSINHSPNLFDAPGTEALSLQNMIFFKFKCIVLIFDKQLCESYAKLPIQLLSASPNQGCYFTL